MSEFESKALLLNRYIENPKFVNDKILGCDLTNEKFNNVYFNNVDIEKSFLDYTDLSASAIDGLNVNYCNLREIDFSNSTIFSGNYKNNEMIRANFSNCDLNGLKFDNSRCFSLKLNNSVMSDTSIYQCEINRASFNRTMVIKSRFESGDKMEVAGFIKVTVIHSTFIDCDFNNIYFGDSVIENSTFINCRFNNIEFYNTEVNDTDFINCRISPSVDLPTGINRIRIENE